MLRAAVRAAAPLCSASQGPRIAAPRPFTAIKMSSASGPARRRSTAAAATPSSEPVVAAAAATGNLDVQGDMLDAPSVANKNTVRFLAAAAVVAGLARGTAFLPATGIAFVHLLAYASWLGTIVWTTFVAGITMYKNLPRQTFGKLQAKLFPPYFGLSAICCTIQLGVLLFASQAAPQKQLVLLGIGLATSLANLVWAEPTCTRVMLKRYALENAPGERDEATIKSLAKQFGKWHGLSSVINLGTLVVAVGHGWWLASQMLGVLA